MIVFSLEEDMLNKSNSEETSKNNEGFAGPPPPDDTPAPLDKTE